MVQRVKSAHTLINTIFKWFIVKDIDVSIRFYKSLAVTKILYCSSVWEPISNKHINMLEGFQTRFLSLLRWRCPLERDAVHLTSLISLLKTHNERLSYQLRQINMIEHFFDLRQNNRRSKCTHDEAKVRRPNRKDEQSFRLAAIKAISPEW